MGNVIPAVEKVVYIDLPIAANVITSAVEVIQLADTEWSDALDQTSKKFVQRLGVRIEVHKDEALPGLDANREKAVLSTIKILHAFELGHAFQRTVKSVPPAMIRTLQHRGVAAWLRDHRGGVMAADVIKSAQGVIASANYHDWFFGDPCRNKIAGIVKLIGARDELPCLAEHVEPL